MAILDNVPERSVASSQKLRVVPALKIPAGAALSPAPNVSPASTAPSAPGTASAPQAARGLRIAAVLLRTAFIFVLIVLVMRVAQPQSETIWTAYETPGDLIRLWLGIGVCIWLVWQLFEGPTDAHGYRTWLYLGLTALPFALICTIAIW